MIDHDRLFKELLSTFFREFLELFAPELAAAVEPESLEFIDKEAFAALPSGKRHVVDLLARVRLRRPGRASGPATYVLVHVETQAQRQRDFARRMFRYFASLSLNHSLPVYPVALFSYRSPRRAEPAQLDLELPGLHVLRFRFRTIQLNRLEWRAFLKRPNPVAAALMSRMNIAPQDRPRVKAECLRLLTTLRLKEDRAYLVMGFVESYLRLSAQEQKLFEEQVERMPTKERESMLELTTSWTEKGRAEGRAEGREQEALGVVLRLLAKRLGPLGEPIAARVQALGLEELETLAEDLLDFESASDLERWLARRQE